MEENIKTAKDFDEMYFMEEVEYKLKHGIDLDELHIEEIACDSVYEQVFGKSRWYEYVTSIIEIKGEFYAIDWSRGLTEYQENEYPCQPKRVKKVVKDKIYTVEAYVDENDDIVAEKLKLFGDLPF